MKNTVATLAAMKKNGEKISQLTCYDYSTAKIIDAAGINMMKLLTEDVVYGRRGKCIYNETTALWSNVPRGILTRYVTSPALREEMKQYKALHTLWCGGDLAPARVYRLARYYAAQYKNFAHYYFDKSKEK